MTSMTPMRIGPAHARMFAALHRPSPTEDRRFSVLMCNPFGQEAIRAHRLLKVIADRLCRSGFTVMRFDYYGTGDSDGDCLAAELSRWPADVLVADAELTSLGASTRRAWFGMGLGGWAAAEAATGRAAALAALVLCDPVVDGRAYLDRLRAAHRRLTSAYTPREFALIRAVSDPNRIMVEEILGFPLSSASVQCLEKCAEALPGGHPRTHNAVVMSPISPEACPPTARWFAAGTPVRFRSIRAWADAQFNDVIASGVVNSEIGEVVADVLSDAA